MKHHLLFTNPPVHTKVVEYSPLLTLASLDASESCNQPETQLNSHELTCQIPQMHLAGWYWSCRLQHPAAYCYCPEHLHFHWLHLIGLLLKIGFLMDPLWAKTRVQMDTSLKMGGILVQKTCDASPCMDFPPQKFQAIQAYYIYRCVLKEW